ncbi:hypothetical protein D0Z00_000519 [Geotrichum galactomycetum]|uniref:Uncharacterized protein n=1 Tax=Geotrichum galactomycetum TaxID=27317 RepID=A0ACB6V9H1_9ASCO|nr:hypothetical protein D0Z00_000519 [Geotrichum candidum]
MAVESYVTGDEANAKDKVLYFFTDVIGHKFINAQLIADQYAETGYYVIAPDLFNADPILLNPPEGFDFAQWLPHHGIDVTQPIIDKIAEGVKTKFGKPKFAAAVGFCFGAKYAIRLLSTDTIQSASVFHPSLVEISEVEAIKGSLLISAPDDDYIYTTELRHETEKTLKELGKKGIKYRQVLYNGIGHGFAIRGDISLPLTKYAKERAFNDTVEWFQLTNDYLV